MSELITNLQAIYNTKLAIKEAIGTVSDNFVDYPSYISGMVTPTGTYNISDNGTFDVSTYASAYVNVSGGGQTIAQKNAAWQTKWAPALSTMAAGLYAQDPSYGEPQITSPSGWCVQTALDGNAAMSELIALDSLWIEIFGYGSNLHEQYVQIFTQMGLTLDSDGNLVSTDDDKILPFDVDEAIVTNLTGVLGFGCLGGKKISSLNGGIENAKWNYYGTVFNGTGFDYAYIGQFDCVVDQLTMVNQMQRDGITFINNIPAVNQNTLHYYLESFQLDGTVIPTGTSYVTVNGNYDISSYAYVDVNVSGGGGGFPYDVTQSFYQLNGTTLKYIMEDSGEPRWICSLDPNQSALFTILYYTGSNVFHGLSSALSNTIDDTNVGVGSMNNDRLSSQTSDFGAFIINNTSSKVVSISIYCHYRSNTTIDLDLSWVADEPKE